MFGDASRVLTLTCVLYLSEKTLVTGTENGQLYVWRDRQLHEIIEEAHEVSFRAYLDRCGPLRGACGIVTSRATLSISCVMSELYPSRQSLGAALYEPDSALRILLVPVAASWTGSSLDVMARTFY